MEEPMSQEIGGLMAGGLTAGMEALPAEPGAGRRPGAGPAAGAAEAWPTAGGVWLSGVSGGVCGVDADVGVSSGVAPAPPADPPDPLWPWFAFIIFLNFDRLFWNQILTCQRNGPLEPLAEERSGEASGNSFRDALFCSSRSLPVKGEGERREQSSRKGERGERARASLVSLDRVLPVFESVPETQRVLLALVALSTAFAETSC